jgi:hypothetical protein
MLPIGDVMIKTPSPDNDTFRRFPRTLQEAFPSCPEWVEKPPLSDTVLTYLCAFSTGFLVAFVVFA